MQFIAPYQRAKVKAIAVLLAAVTATLPMSASIYLAMRNDAQAAHGRAALAADQALGRASGLLRNVALALDTVERDKHPPCSPAHIGAMRATTLVTRGVEEIGYAADTVQQCSSWGVAETGASTQTADFSLSNGMEVTRDVAPAIHADKSLTRLRYGAHYALLDPDAFTDLPVVPDVRIALAAADGHALGGASATGFPDADSQAYAIRSDGTLTAIGHATLEQGAGALLRNHLPVLLLGALGSVLVLALSARLVKKRLSPRAGMVEAIRRREFEVHYQPIVDLASGACTGAEALVRWRRADGSLIVPDRFIAFAGKTGLILPITDQVVGAVIAELGELLARRSDLHIAINVCAQDIQSGRILDVLEAARAGSGVRPHQIWLEVTESGIRDAEATRATLLEAHRLGYRSAIDDFGTGYSALSCLEGLPLDVLKIDKSFIGAEPESGCVLAHIIALGKSLGMKMVAEGIETPEQAAFLAGQGVDYGQGWYYAKAMPASGFLAWMQDA